MPMSRLARRFWPGSSTSAPLTNRSNLSFGPSAALATGLRVLMAASEAEPARASNVRRETAGMAFLRAVLFGAWRENLQHGMRTGQARARSRALLADLAVNTGLLCARKVSPHPEQSRRF